jgi:hypothetical protein
MKKTNNLMDGLLKEMNRVRELITEYKSLPGGAGMLGASLMAINIQMAEKAISNGDVIEMLVQYEKLKNCE